MNAKNGFHPHTFRLDDADRFEPEFFRLTKTPHTDEWCLVPRFFDGNYGGIFRISLSSGDEDDGPLEPSLGGSKDRKRSLDMGIHASFLGDHGAQPDSMVESFRFCDVSAVELAHSLIESEGSAEPDSLARSYIFRILCARLKDLFDLIKSSAKRRFESWQLAELSEVFYEQRAEEVSVASTAARCRLSVCQFSRIFKATYGMPLHQFVMKERVKRAQYLLSETGDPIAQIALDCGFADQSSFTRRFSTATGVPPGLFRKQSRRDPYDRPIGALLMVPGQLTSRAC